MYSGKQEGLAHQYGVGILMSPRLQESLMEWNPVIERRITARMKVVIDVMSR